MVINNLDLKRLFLKFLFVTFLSNLNHDFRSKIPPKITGCTASTINNLKK